MQNENEGLKYADGIVIEDATKAIIVKKEGDGGTSCGVNHLTFYCNNEIDNSKVP